MLPLLRTKTTVPQARPRLVERPRLLELVAQGTRRALTLIVAPAGFGKMTLATAYAQTAQIPVAWLSLQPADRPRERFLSYLIRALQPVAPQIGQTTLALLQGGSPAGALFALVNDLAEVKGDFVLVLDDYHTVDCPETAEILQFLLENRPATFHLILTARAAPALNLSRLRALDMRDKETEGHSERVAEMALQLARVLGVGGVEAEHIRRGALLHDLGKIGIPDSILLKPGPLTDEEWEVMRTHPVHAYELLLPIPYLLPALEIPYCHHEKWDGSGYPRGLIGEKIPLAARIFAVVDVYDALMSDRPYRPAWSKEKTLQYMLEQSGKHFDPQVVDAFLKHILAKTGLSPSNPHTWGRSKGVGGLPR